MSQSPFKVIKFGGSSVGKISSIHACIDIIEKYYNPKNLCVVFSAHGGVTDVLVNLYTLAYEKKDTDPIIAELKKKHFDLIDNLIHDKTSIQNLKKEFEEYFTDIANICFSIKTLQEYSARISDRLISYGEIFSNRILFTLLKGKYAHVHFLDARKVIKTDSHFGHANVHFTKTNVLIKKYFAEHKGLVVCTGFIASDDDGVTTTLGRSGSDYTASIIAGALKAEHLDIWTDVSGIMTSDPRKVSEAFYLPKISYEEAMELSHFGAKVIFSSTMLPAMNNNIPIAIKNTFEPEHPGTIIHKHKKDIKHHTVKGVSAISDVSMIRVEGVGMISRPGISYRFFKALGEAKVNVILISQASSEYSICICVATKDSSRAIKVLDEEFKEEIRKKLFFPSKLENNLAIVAVVGEGIRNTVGSAGNMFATLGKAGVNIHAIAQGSSELNISAVVLQKDLAKSINVLHESFFLSHTKKAHIFLLGIGQIGKKLLDIIASQHKDILEKFGLDLKVCALSNSKKMVLNEKGIAFEKMDSVLSHASATANMKSFVDSMIEFNLANSIFVDCSSSHEPPLFYSQILKKGISIVTPNKKANSSKIALYEELKTLSTKHTSRFYYETNVGAGLPIINTIQDLILSGDEVIKMEAVLSGTLNYLFSLYDGNMPFSQLVVQAKEKGFTEPDPRDDLEGMDVARKILILAREAGHRMELNQVKVQSLITPKLKKEKTVQAFLKNLSSMDSHYKKLYDNALAKGKKLRYCAMFENKKATVELKEIDTSHPFYRLQGTDNIVIITTKRYFKQPMIIKGPGAGIEVTGAGVFADIIRVAKK